MKINVSFLYTTLIILIFTSFYSCKKNDSQTDSATAAKYSNLPTDISSVARWYDQQISELAGSGSKNQNLLDWSKTIKSTMPNGSSLYALSMFHSDSLIRELNVNKTNDNQLYAVFKEYSRDKQTGVITLSLFDIKVDILDDADPSKMCIKNELI